jgi:hypothetical protein
VIACIKEYLLGTKCGLRQWWFSKKRNVFKEVYDEGYSPLSPTEWHDQGLSSVGSAELGVSMKDHPLI